MIRLLLLVLLSWALPNFLYAQSVRTFKVMTYNIRSFEPDFNVSGHIQLIKNEKPDLIAFQEVETRTSRILKKDLVAAIGAATGMFPLFVPAYPKDIGEYGVAILSKYPITSSYHLPLPRLQAEGAADPRVALVADLMLPGNFKLRFVNTHLDHLYGNGSIQLEQSKPLCTSTILDGKTPVILAGDINQGINGNAVNYITGFYNRQCNNAHTFEGGSKLDYVFTYPKIGWTSKEQKVLHNILLSDHYPVIVTLEYKQ